MSTCFCSKFYTFSSNEKFFKVGESLTKLESMTKCEVFLDTVYDYRKATMALDSVHRCLNKISLRSLPERI